MDEILQKLLESELLSEESKTEIKDKFESFINEVKEQTTLEVKAYLTEEFVAAREELVETVNEKVNQFLLEEFEDLRGDLENFRDLEVEYAEKILEEKEILANQLSEELDELTNKIDAFLEIRLSEEFSELVEDIEVIKKDSFGRKLFEAFSEEYARSFAASSEDSAEKKLAELEDRLSDAQETIAEMEASHQKIERSRKLDELLGPLTGSKYEHMKLLLSNVSTDKLSEAFSRYIGRVLKEDSSTKITTKSIITEDEEDKEDLTVITGNEMISEDLEKDDSKKSLLRIKELAGI